MEINISGERVHYNIPVLTIQTYMINKIFEKNLLFLIPFYIFSYERRFKEYVEDVKKHPVLLFPDQERRPRKGVSGRLQ